MPSFRRLPSGNWQAGVLHPSGKRYYKSDPLRRVVAEWAADLERDIRRGSFVDPNAGKVRLVDWWTSWSEDRTVAKATASKNESHWRNHLLDDFGTWPLSSIQPKDVRAWVKRKSDDPAVGAETVASSLRLLRQLLDAAVADRLLKENPAAGVRAPTPPPHIDRFLDIDEADRLLESITMPDRSAEVPRGQRYPRIPDLGNRLFVHLLLDAGLRWQEAAGLQRRRLDLRRGLVTVQEVAERGSAALKLEPKTPAGARRVPLTPELVDLLRDRVRGRQPTDLVFPGPDGGVMDYANWLKRVWNPAVKAAGLADPQPTPHDCRHSYGSWLAEEGVPPHEIMALMGHSSLRAVEIYIHASGARMERARAALKARRRSPGASGESGAG